MSHFKDPSNGPFSSAALAERAISQLREHAESMALRGCDPDEIAVALTRESELWRAEGAELPVDVIPTIVPGMSPDAAQTAEYVRRVFVLANWLFANAMTESAWLIVDAAVAILLVTDEEEVPC